MKIFMDFTFHNILHSLNKVDEISGACDTLGRIRKEINRNVAETTTGREDDNIKTNFRGLVCERMTSGFS